MRKFLAQREHSVNICHDCYYCFIITIVVILALGKLNMPAQALQEGYIHAPKTGSEAIGTGHRAD